MTGILYRIGIHLKRYPREESENFSERGRGFRALIVPVRRASLMCIEKMIDGMSDACYLEHYCFRHRLHSYSRAARFLHIATCHTSSLFCVTACHMTRCIIKTAALIFSRGGGSVMQGFSDILPRSDTKRRLSLGFPHGRGRTFR